MKLKWKGILLWSNQFYGICAALLAVDAGMSILHRPPSPLTLFLVYLTTIIFYTHAYLQEANGGIYGERTKWYQENNFYLNVRQVVFSIACLYLIFIHFNGWNLFWTAPIATKIIVVLAFFISAVYYIPYQFLSVTVSFRKLGLLKSISIAWVWSITCCFVPLWLDENKLFSIHLNSLNFWAYFFQLFIFILILAILFDIKDLYRDKEEAVHTIIVKHGIEKTVRIYIIPLLIIYGLFSLFLFFYVHYTIAYCIIHLFLILLTYWVSIQVSKVKSIHNNILLIDGLMYLKAILSILYMSSIH